jgi:glycerol-3-phosphate acyltransferase
LIYRQKLTIDKIKPHITSYLYNSSLMDVYINPTPSHKNITPFLVETNREFVCYKRRVRTITTMASSTFPTINKCTSIGREKHTVVADMDGTLLIGRSSFPYFALIAFEVGGVLRLLIYLLSSPIAALLYYFISESAGIQVLVFASMAGMKLSSIESVARAVLPKFYSSDLHPETWRVFSSCGKRCVLTANPRIMVEPFLKEFLGADLVLGTEIASYKGRATGLICNPGILVGDKKAQVLKKTFGDEKPDIGLGDRVTDAPFMALCKVILIKLSKSTKS